jgi:hypothetical protein
MMNNTFRSLIIIAGFMFLVLVGVVALSNQVKNLSNNEGELQIMGSPNPTLDITPIDEEKDVLLYFVDLDDNGQNGLKIGCNDSLVSVTQKIDNTAMPLTVAIEKLIGMKEQIVGADLYNSLYQSNLTLEKTTISTDNIAEIYLSGELKLGGTCDAPRAQAQLEQTVMQFSSVKEVKIYLNNQPLDVALSTK